MAIDLIALHRLTVRSGQAARTDAVGALNASSLPTDTVDQLDAYVRNVEERDETAGRASAGWYDPAQPAELKALLAATNASQFGTASGQAMMRLAATVRGNASDGVVLFLRIVGSPNRVACFKLDPERVTRTQVVPGARGLSTALAVQHLANTLPEPRDLKKGALFPSPSGADVRVIDLTTAEVAGYWVRFLGVVSVQASATAKALFDATVTALQGDGVAVPAARRAVSEEWGGAGRAGVPAPEVFVRAAASRTRADPARTWSAVRQAAPDLAGAHATITAPVARRLTQTVDLGGGVKISGPAGEVDLRVEEGQDAAGWFVKVRATGRPQYLHGR
jgi:hypothetical protein